jgi:DNA repair protein RadC
MATEEERKQKLTTILYAIRALPEFSSDHAKDLCKDIAPAYVTKTLKLLVKEGHLGEVERDKSKLLVWTQKNIDLDFEQWINRQVYGEQIKQTPEEDRPRERLLRDGPASLTDADLIAILIRVGVVGESAVQAGRKLANRFSGRIAALADSSLHELRGMSKAIRRDSYSQIMAGIELGRRIAAVHDADKQATIRIRGSDDAIRYCARTFARLAVDGKQEQFHIVTLDTQYGPIANHLITIGTLDASLVHPREVFRPAIRDAASAILLVHNHPSGDPTPSREDHAVTKRLEEVGETIGIKVLDHIVVAKERCVSILSVR